MGSQWAPILCSAVALQREFIFCEIYGSVQSEWSLAHRYVDNRLLITPRHTFQTLSVQLFWNLSFYTPPIMLETVEGDEALGFSISLPQRSITMILPWKKSLRSTRSAGPSGQVLSGLLARIRLICTNVFPARLRLAQIQDLLGLMFTRNSALFTSTNRRQIRHVLHRLISQFHQYDFFCWCR